MNNEILEKINKLEQQILVWACCYYRFDYNIVSDAMYDNKGWELMELIKQYPNEFKKSKYYEEFYEYDKGDTPSAFNINFMLPNIQSRAWHLIQLLKEENNNEN